MAFHLFDIKELYTNADGTVQYIELAVGSNGEHQWVGQKIEVKQGASTHTFFFPNDLPSSATANKTVLIATQGFATLTGITPDFIVPDGFLFQGSAGTTTTVNFAGVSVAGYTTIPTNGTTSLNGTATSSSPNNPTIFTTQAAGTPKNFAGQTVTLQADPDQDPTGSVVITGTVTENQTLAADASAVQDGNGLGPFSYQWLRNGSTIGGATHSTYTLGDNDVGTRISVRVSYTDGDGYPEQVTSAQTEFVANVNDAPTGAPTISGTASEGSTLTANTGGIADADGLGTFGYQWLRNGNPVGSATNSTYQLTQADVGFAISVRVSYTDARGAPEQLTSAATAAVTNVNNPPTGSVTITGTVTEDQTLTADAGGVQDADGLGAFSYQWLRDGAEIGGATSNQYTLGDADVGHSISVRADYTDQGGTAESVTSSQTAGVANVDDAPTGSVAISGSVTEGQVLTADAGSIADADGLGAFSYQWLRGGAVIPEATAATYVLVQADVGEAIRVRVSYTDDHGTAQQLTSSATAAVQNTNDLPTGSVTILGAAAVGQQLTADTSGLADGDGLGAFSFQWLRNGAEIGGAASSTYTLVAADRDTHVAVRVSYTDARGTPETVTSEATADVQPQINLVEGTAGDDLLVGTAEADLVNGLAGDDTLSGAGGDDFLDGGAGVDTADLGVGLAGILHSQIGASEIEVQLASGVVSMTGIERVALDDAYFAFDTDVGERVWNAEALLWAAFGAAPGSALLGQWVAAADAAADLEALAQAMIDFYAPGVGSAALVTHLFGTLLHISPTPDQLEQFTSMIGPGQAFEDNAGFLAFAAAHEINTARFTDFAGSIQVLDGSWF